MLDSLMMGDIVAGGVPSPRARSLVADLDSDTPIATGAESAAPRKGGCKHGCCSKLGCDNSGQLSTLMGVGDELSDLRLKMSK